MDYAELLDQHEKRVADLVRRKKEIRELLVQLANEEESLDQELQGLTEAANAYRFLTQKAFLAERPDNQTMATAAASGNGFTDAMRSVARRIRMPPARQ
jgi:uncharacterized protein YlxW (UPF0749 family)